MRRAKLRDGVTVARETLNLLVKVRILVPEFFLSDQIRLIIQLKSKFYETKRGAHIRTFSTMKKLPFAVFLQSFLFILFLSGISTIHADPIDDLRQRAEAGDMKAQLDLGVKYELGQGVPKDYDKALRWYRKSADQGFARGYYNVGALHYNGYGVPPNEAEAAIWMKKAADKGYAKAQSTMGYFYESAKGVPRDFSQARIYYAKAAAQGEVEAKKALEKLEKRQKFMTGSTKPGFDLDAGPITFTVTTSDGKPVQDAIIFAFVPGERQGPCEAGRMPLSNGWCPTEFYKEWFVTDAQGTAVMPRLSLHSKSTKEQANELVVYFKGIDYQKKRPARFENKYYQFADDSYSSVDQPEMRFYWQHSPIPQRIDFRMKFDQKTYQFKLAPVKDVLQSSNVSADFVKLAGMSASDFEAALRRALAPKQLDHDPELEKFFEAVSRDASKDAQTQLSLADNLAKELHPLLKGFSVDWQKGMVQTVILLFDRPMNEEEMRTLLQRPKGSPEPPKLRFFGGAVRIEMNPATAPTLSSRLKHYYQEIKFRLYSPFLKYFLEIQNVAVVPISIPRIAHPVGLRVEYDLKHPTGLDAFMAPLQIGFAVPDDQRKILEPPVEERDYLLQVQAQSLSVPLGAMSNSEGKDTVGTQMLERAQNRTHLRYDLYPKSVSKINPDGAWCLNKSKQATASPSGENLMATGYFAMTRRYIINLDEKLNSALLQSPELQQQFSQWPWLTAEELIAAGYVPIQKVHAYEEDCFEIPKN